MLKNGAHLAPFFLNHPTNSYFCPHKEFFSHSPLMLFLSVGGNNEINNDRGHSFELSGFGQ